MCDGHRDQHHGRLDMRRPHIGARQYRIEQVEPGAVRRFRRDPQPADKGNADGADQQPMQDNRPVVGLARLHRRLPVGEAQPAQHETLFKQRTLLRNTCSPDVGPPQGERKSPLASTPLPRHWIKLPPGSLEQSADLFA